MIKFLPQLNIFKAPKRKIFFVVLVCVFCLIAFLGLSRSTVKATDLPEASQPVGTDWQKVASSVSTLGAEKWTQQDKNYSLQPGWEYTNKTSAGQFWYYKIDNNTYSVVWQDSDGDYFIKPQDISSAQYTQIKKEDTGEECPTADIFCYLRKFTLWIANGILWLFSWLVWLGAQLLDISVNLPQLMGGFTTSPIVAIGWPIIRDLANMFFALVLLVIAFATILRIETYGMKQVLWKLVVAALLINFSLTIAGVIIDGSNVLTNFFIRGNFVQKDTNQPADISAAIYNGLKLQQFYNTDITKAAQSGTGISGGGAVSTSQLKILLNMLLGAVFMIITAFVLFAAAILFFIRMIALWILLIFAPMAWLAMILPATRSMWNKWWHEFFKWIIFAPVYAFFIYLTVAVINNNILQKTLEQGNAAYQGDGFIITQFLGSNLGFVANYVVLTIFLLAGLIFARQSGITGASAMVNLGTNMRQGGMRILSRWQAGGAKIPGADWMSKKFGPQRWLRSESKFIQGLARGFQAPGAAKRFLATQTNREVWIRAWATMKQRADENAFNVPAANIVGTWEQMKRAGGLLTKTQVPKLDESGNPVQKKDSEGIPMTDVKGKPIYETEEKAIRPMQALRNIFSPEKLEGERATQAITARRMQEYGNIKDEERLVHYYQQAKDPRDKEALLRLLASMNGINTLFRSMGKSFDAGKLKSFIQDAFTPEDAARIAADIQGIGAANNNYSYVGLTKWDPRLGKSRFTDDNEQEDIIRIKIRQMDSQKFDVTVHNDTFRGFDENGNRAFNRFGNAALDELNSDHAEYARRFAPRVKYELAEIVQEIKTGKAPEGVRLKEGFRTSPKAKDAIKGLGEI